MLATTLQGAVLSAVSNVLAQMISCYQNGKPLSIAWTPILNFTLFALLVTPPNVLWQEFLENTFPGTHPPLSGAEEKKGQSKSKPSPGRLNVWNAAVKVILDQTLAGTLNSMAFLAFFAYLQQPTLENVLQVVKRDLLPVYLAGLKLWPAVSILCFTVIPVEQRILTGSLAGMAWNIYLSLLAS